MPRDASAGGAAGLALEAAATARQAGELRVVAGSGEAADGANQGRQGAAVGAERALGGAGVHSPPFLASDADLGVRRVGDQAVRTQRSPLLVAGGRLASGSAAYTFFDAGLGDAVATDPLPVERLVDANHSVAPRAGRPDDPGDTRLVQKVDEPQDGAVRGEMGLAGQQTRILLQGPDHSLAIVKPVGCRPAQSLSDHVAVGARGKRVDHRVDDRSRVTVIVVRTHRTAWQALAVPEGDAPGVAAGGALAGVLDADRAVPVLALPLEASQPLPTVRADR
jgi:hypothetical protein